MPTSPESLQRAAETRDRSLDDLRHAVDLGMIRNADLEGIKFSLGRAWYDESSALPDLLGRPDRTQAPARFTREFDLDQIWYEIVRLPPYSLNHVRVIAKRLPAILKKVDEPDARISAAAEAVMILHDRWLPLAILLEQVKPLIVKGRQPSETPVDPRTLENTGTCSCCDRNIKLKDLKIVDHGFQVNGGRHGQCFGVGYYPIEVSTQGVVEMVKRLEAKVESTQGYLHRVEIGEVNVFHIGSPHKLEKVDREHPKFARVRLAKIEEAKSEISHLKVQIRFANAKIVAWTPRKLPDGAGHFALEHNQDPPSSPRP